MLKQILTGLCDLVYPPHCLICQCYLSNHPNDGHLCPKCLGTIQYNKPPFCPVCTRSMGLSPKHRKCRNCRKTTPGFDFAWAACPYLHPIKPLIIHFKYHQRTYLRKPLARIILKFTETYYLDLGQFDYLLPIPLHLARFRERGYNQSELLAQIISAKTKIPLNPKVLSRIRNTAHQTLLSEKERWTNIQGAFRITQPLQVSGKNILLIDDLLTTGATASEAARTLKAGGADKVGLLTLAVTN